MSKILDAAKRAAGAASAGASVYQLAVSVEGQPIAKRTEPAAVRVFGIPIFVRDETLERTWFGVIHRGRSAVAKRALAEKGGPGK